jgi:hypothetical protein
VVVIGGRFYFDKYFPFLFQGVMKKGEEIIFLQNDCKNIIGFGKLVLE